MLSVPYFTPLHSLGDFIHTQVFIYSSSLTQQTQESYSLLGHFLPDPKYLPLSASPSPAFSSACQNLDIFQYLLKASLLSLSFITVGHDVFSPAVQLCNLRFVSDVSP